MYRSALLFVFGLLLFSCTKKRLKETTIDFHHPVDQQVYHEGDTVFIDADISYKKEIKNIGFFVALDAQGPESDSNFYKRTILPMQNPYAIHEYYVSDFDAETKVTLSYGKRNVNSGQIYEIKTLELTFLP